MKIIISLIWYVGRFFSFLYPSWIMHQLKNGCDVFYSSWITRNIDTIDSTSRFMGDNIVVGPKLIEIGNNCRFGKGTAITAFNSGKEKNCKIRIGSRCIFGNYNHITSSNSIIIGDNLRTGTFVIITDNSHGDPKDKSMLYRHPDERPIYSKGGIVIGKNVWVGDKATILPNCTIGDYCIIGANTVITHDVPAFSIAVGCPAKIYKR